MFRRVLAGEEPLASKLASNTHIGGVGIRTGIAHARSDATIAITEYDSASVIDSNFVKVEQISIRITAAAKPDTAGALHRIVRRDIHDGPRVAAIVSSRDEEIPNAWERCALEVARTIGTKETDGSTIAIAGDTLGKYCILDAVTCTQIRVF